MASGSSGKCPDSVRQSAAGELVVQGSVAAELADPSASLNSDMHFHPSVEELEEMLSREKLSKKHRQMQKGFEYQEKSKMRKVDYESHLLRAVESEMLAKEIAQEDAEMLTKLAKVQEQEPKFRNGQSVLQWWAAWMDKCTVVPKQLKGKARPAWFDATVVVAQGIGETSYAGTNWREHLYQVH